MAAATYLTPTEFRTMSFPSGSFASVLDPEIQYEIDVASSMVDAALRPHHTLPIVLTETRDIGVLKDCVLVISSYRLQIKLGFMPNLNGSQDNTLYQRYLEITHPENGYLARLSQGQILLSREVDQTHRREQRSQGFGPGSSSFSAFSNSNRGYFQRYNCRGEPVV